MGESSPPPAAAWRLAGLFLLNGLSRIAGLDSASQRMAQSLVPSSLNLVAPGGARKFCAFLLLIPGLRPFGVWLEGFLPATVLVRTGAAPG